MMKNHPVKDRLLRMSRTIDSRHSGRMASRSGPTHGDDRVSLERRDEARLERENQVRKRQLNPRVVIGDRSANAATARIFLLLLGSNFWDKKLGRRNASASVEACKIKRK
jgi:hypothetical protein